jgi:hypothetical protein
MRKYNYLKENDTFGKWTIISDGPIIKTKARSFHYFCKCACGDTKRWVNASDLVNSRSICCNKCSQYSGHNELSLSFFNVIKKGAISRGLEFNITIEAIYHLLEKQDFKCNLSGIDIKLHKRHYKNRKEQTASLDRIDSSKGYTLDNVQWLHRDINIMKNTHKQEYFIELCKKVAD